MSAIVVGSGIGGVAFWGFCDFTSFQPISARHTNLHHLGIGTWRFGPGTADAPQIVGAQGNSRFMRQVLPVPDSFSIAPLGILPLVFVRIGSEPSSNMCRRHWSLPLFILALSAVSAQEQHHQFFRWNSPAANLAANDVLRRQASPPGYHPEFGTCGSGRTCEDACGPNWESCQASTDLSLFCYNRVDLNQTCCENGSGRACDAGYYCAWLEIGGRVWCCENGQSLEECGVPTSASATTSATISASDNPNPGPSGTSDGQCPAATVTSWATTTIVSTVSFEVTVSDCGDGSSSSGSPSRSSPHESTTPTETDTITQPAYPTSSPTRPPFTMTTTSTLVTAGSETVRVNLWTVAWAVISLVLV
ncbi:hypothetical protein VTK26DRAFT_8999 [Humicola hyalothermophila]